LIYGRNLNYKFIRRMLAPSLRKNQLDLQLDLLICRDRKSRPPRSPACR